MTWRRLTPNKSPSSSSDTCYVCRVQIWRWSITEHVLSVAAQKSKRRPGGLPCLCSTGRYILRRVSTTTHLVSPQYDIGADVLHRFFDDKLDAALLSPVDGMAALIRSTTAASLPVSQPTGSGDVIDATSAARQGSRQWTCANLPSEWRFQRRRSPLGRTVQSVAAVWMSISVT